MNADLLELPTQTRPLPAVYRNLVSIALLATIYRVGEDAQIVSDAVETVLAQPLQYSLYKAVTLGMAGRLDEVKAALGRQLEDQSADDGTKIAYAVSLLFGGDIEWRYWIDNVLATSIDPQVRQAALGVLNFVGGAATRQ